MARRRRSSGLPDRAQWAAGAGLGTWALLGGRFGAGVGLLVGVAVAFPGLIRGARAGSPGADTKPAAAGVAALAALVALLGINHPTLVAVLAAAVALAVWLWPRWRRYAASTGRHHAPTATARAGRARVRGNHHGRVQIVEEVPTGRVGIARKRGGDGPTQVELCAKTSITTDALRSTANKRLVHSRWSVARGPARCPLTDQKRHWVLRSAGPAERTK